MKFRTRILPIALAWTFAIVMFTIVGRSSAQEATTTDETRPPPEPTEERPEPIPAAEVPNRAVEVLKILQDIETKIAPRATEQQIRAELPSLILAVDSLGQDTVGVAVEDLGRQLVQDIHQGWLRHKAQVDSWESAMRGRTQDLEDYRDELREMSAVWKVTLETALADSAPEVLVERIELMLADIGAGEKVLVDRMGELIALQSKLTDEKIRITGALAWVEARRAAVEDRVFQRESSPIWRVRDDVDTETWERALKLWTRHADAIAGYVSGVPAGLIIQFIVFVLLTVFIGILQHRSKRLIKEDHSVSDSIQVLSYPAAASALLVLLFSDVFHLQPPVVFLDLTDMLTVVPLLVILARLTNKRYHGAIFATGFLYVFHKLYSVSSQETVLARLILLTVSAGGIAVLLRILSVARKEGQHVLAVRALLTMVKLGLALLGIAFLANVWGSVRLAALLTLGTYNTIFGGALLYLVVRVLSGIITLSFKTRTLQISRIVRMHSDVVAARTIRLLQVAGVVVWVGYILKVFSVRSDVVGGLTAVFDASWKLGALEISVGSIITFFVTIYLALLLSRLIRFTLNEEILPRIALPRGVAGAMTKILHYLIVTAGFFIALTASGFDLGRVAIVAGALSVGIGFGLQSVVNNFVSGLILLLERPIGVGDTIELGTLKGRVRRIGIRSSIIKTFDGAEVIVPNADLISREVTNWTMSDRNRRIEITVGVAYGTDPNKVLEILRGIAEKNKGILDFPEPMVLFLGFGESSLDFSLRAWTARFDGWLALSSEMTLQVHDALKGAGIEIPFPQRDLHLRSIDEGASAAIEGKKRARPPTPRKNPADDASPTP
ncbi:MAG: mechanosensitive ion channel [bacterium]|nr:mechanosensitive ion channel [bacterium]